MGVLLLVTAIGLLITGVVKKNKWFIVASIVLGVIIAVLYYVLGTTLVRI